MSTKQNLNNDVEVKEAKKAKTVSKKASTTSKELKTKPAEKKTVSAAKKTSAKREVAVETEKLTVKKMLQRPM